MSAPFVYVGEYVGENTEEIVIPVTVDVPKGASLFIITADAYGYGTDIIDGSDTKDGSYGSYYEGIRINNGGSVFFSGGEVNTALQAGVDTIYLFPNRSWTYCQATAFYTTLPIGYSQSEQAEVGTTGGPLSVSLNADAASINLAVATYQNGNAGATVGGGLNPLFETADANQGTVIQYLSTTGAKTIPWTVTPSDEGYGAMAILSFDYTSPPPVDLDLTGDGLVEHDEIGAPVITGGESLIMPSGWTSDRIGRLFIGSQLPYMVRLVGITDVDRVGTPRIVPPGVIYVVGRIADSERVGTPSITGPTGLIAPSGWTEGSVGTPGVSGGDALPVLGPTYWQEIETVGEPQITLGSVAIYYGPLPTTLIADAPYSQLYPDGLDSAVEMVANEAKRLVPQQIIPPPKVTSPTPPENVPDMGFSRYKFVITDMMGNVQGEVLQCQQKTLTQVIDNMSTASFTVYLNNPMIDYILNHDCLCKVYRQPVNRNYAYRLMLVGDVCTDEEDTDGDTGTMTFTVVDPLNRLMYRLIGKEVDGSNHGIGFSTGSVTNPQDIADTIGGMLLEVNNDKLLGHTGVTLGIRGPNTPTSYMDPVFFTPFTQQLALYTNVVAGVDFYLEPQEPYSLAKYPPHPGTNPYQPGGPDSSLPPQKIVTGTSVQDTCIAKMNIYAPMGNFMQVEGPPPVYSKGRPYPVFEYGTGKHNVQGYQRIRDRSQLTNMWWNLPDGFPDANSIADPIVHTALGIRTGEGKVSQSIAWRGGYEQVDSGDLGTSAKSLRQQLVNSDAMTTAMSREQITFTPVIDSDEDWTIDYFLGDVCTARAYVKEANNGAGAWRFNGTMRIYGISATVDENDLEQIAITTVSPAGSGISAPSSD